jgi:hypothetical protein
VSAAICSARSSVLNARRVAARILAAELVATFDADRGVFHLHTARTRPRSQPGSSMSADNIPSDLSDYLLSQIGGVNCLLRLRHRQLRFFLASEWRASYPLTP